MKQVEIITLEQLVSENHRYRKFKGIWDFKEVGRKLRLTVKDNTHERYGITKLFRCVLLQFMEDLSDRELEIFLQENNVGKWFCGFGISESTPDHTVFTRARKKVGTNLLSKLFEEMK